MITKKSDLTLNHFAIINSKCEFIPSENETIDLLEQTKSFSVDIDFGIKQDEDIFLVFVKAEINNGRKKKSGYSIFVEGVGNFSIDNSMESSQKQSLINSSVNICITNLRSYINNVTSYYPLGSFNFHSIDMPALFKAKSDEIKNKRDEN